MSEPFTRVTLFVPGVAAAWKEDGVDAEWIANDGAFGQAFSFGTVAPDLVATIDAAPGALVVHFTEDLRDGRAQIVRVVEQLRAAGALAVRLEQSKLGWDIATWLHLFGGDDPWGWHRGAVAFLGGDGTLQSCGMHAFSLPDVAIRLDSGEPGALHQLASILNVYQLDEDPVLRSGDTFAPDRETPRRVLERWPDVDYPESHPCHNPYGVWRLGAPGGTARPAGKLTPVFVPALHAILRALEDAHGPLSQAQVEAARDEAACMTMAPRDAQKLERSRGYADLDPELAWPQWQLVRAG